MDIYDSLLPAFIGCLSFLAMAVYATPAMAYAKNDVVIRAGGAIIDSPGDNGSVNLSGIDVGDFSVEREAIPVVNVSYFFNKHFALELLLGKPPTFKIYGSSGMVTDIPIGEIAAFPLVVVADYYPMHPLSGWQPHCGIGLNYVLPGDWSVNSGLVSQLGADSVEIKHVDPSLGLVLSLGLDYMLTDRLTLATDIYYLDIRAEAGIEVTTAGQVYSAELSGRTSRAPIIYSLSIGYRF